MTAPTIGFGEVFPRAISDSATARRIADSVEFIAPSGRFPGCANNRALIARLLPLIRTLTVGLGISPSPPIAGC